MILFVSGRCDIPAYYTPWFLNRIIAGYVDVRNPFNSHQISRIPLTKEHVDVVFFCTKNPLPILPYLEKFPFPFIFHITLTAYKQDIERKVPDKKKIIEAIKMLSKQYGKHRIVVRYDPILLNPYYTISYHTLAFEKLCKELAGYVNTIIISFVDMYKNTKCNQSLMNLQPLREQDMHQIGSAFGKLASQYKVSVQTCAEAVDLSSYGILSKPCMNMEDITTALGYSIRKPKGSGVRGKVCGCLNSVDIGDYNCCAHECLYCYANYDARQIRERMRQHDPNSSVLLGHLSELDHITIREDKRDSQLSLTL